MSEVLDLDGQPILDAGERIHGIWLAALFARERRQTRRRRRREHIEENRQNRLWRHESSRIARLQRMGMGLRAHYFELPRHLSLQAVAREP